MPTTTTGIATEFITFSRPGATGGGATVTDSDGRIKWAPHNLLLASEQFDSASWTKSNITLTANNIAAPNGTTTADKVAATASAGTAIYQVLSNAPASFTYRLWVKKGSGATDANRFGVRNATTSTDVVIVNVDYDTGAITYVTGSSGVTMTDAGSGWWLLSFVVTSGVTEGNQITLYAGFNFNGETAGEFNYLWGAHLYRSDMGMQANTSAYPMYNPTTPKNLLGFTENITVAPWFAGDVTRAADVALAPNGLQTADSITENSATAAHLITQTQAVGAGPKTVSIYAKANTWGFVQLSFGTAVSGRANFDVTNGVAGSTDHTSSITSVGNGWYRCSVTLTTTAANLEIYVGLVTSGTAARLESYAGTGTRSVYLWGAQLSDSASLDPYVANHFTAPSAAAYYGPRRDFDSAGVCRGLLVEEQRANLTLHTAALENAAWTKTSSDATTKVTSPDGTSSANLVYPTSSTVFVGVRQIIASGAYTSGVYTISVYAKAAGKNVLGIIDFAGSIGVAAYFTLTGSGTATNGLAGYTQSITPVGNGWYRCTMTSTSSWSNTNLLYTWIVVCDAVGSGAVTTSGTNGVQMYGTQTELGSFATSYIPVGATTAGATRLADVASVSTQAFPYSASEGTLVANGSFISLTDTGVHVLASLSNNASTNSVNIYRQSANMQVNAFSAGSLSAGYTVSANTSPIKAAIAYKLNDMNAAVNGTAQTVDTTAALPTGIDRLDIGRMWAVQPGNGWIRQITYIPRRLSDAELASRTTV